MYEINLWKDKKQKHILYSGENFFIDFWLWNYLNIFTNIQKFRGKIYKLVTQRKNMNPRFLQF